MASCHWVTAGSLHCRRVVPPGTSEGWRLGARGLTAPLVPQVPVRLLLSCLTIAATGSQSRASATALSKGAFESPTREFLAQSLSAGARNGELRGSPPGGTTRAGEQLRNLTSPWSSSPAPLTAYRWLLASPVRWSVKPGRDLAPEGQFSSVIFVPCLKWLRCCGCAVVRS